MVWEYPTSLETALSTQQLSLLSLLDILLLPLNETTTYSRVRRQETVICSNIGHQTTTTCRNPSSSFLHTVHVVPCCRALNPCLPQQQDTIPYAVKKNLSLALLKMGIICPKHVELTLEINKTVTVASRWFLYYLTYIYDARSNRNHSKVSYQRRLHHKY